MLRRIALALAIATLAACPAFAQASYTIAKGQTTPLVNKYYMTPNAAQPPIGNGWTLWTGASPSGTVLAGGNATCDSPSGGWTVYDTQYADASGPHITSVGVTVPASAAAGVYTAGVEVNYQGINRGIAVTFTVVNPAGYNLDIAPTDAIGLAKGGTQTFSVQWNLTGSGNLDTVPGDYQWSVTGDGTLSSTTGLSNTFTAGTSYYGYAQITVKHYTGTTLNGVESAAVVVGSAAQLAPPSTAQINPGSPTGYGGVSQTLVEWGSVLGASDYLVYRSSQSNVTPTYVGTAAIPTNQYPWILSTPEPYGITLPAYSPTTAAYWDTGIGSATAYYYQIASADCHSWTSAESQLGTVSTSAAPKPAYGYFTPTYAGSPDHPSTFAPSSTQVSISSQNGGRGVAVATALGSGTPPVATAAINGSWTLNWNAAGSPPTLAAFSHSLTQNYISTVNAASGITGSSNIAVTYPTTSYSVTISNTGNNINSYFGITGNPTGWTVPPTDFITVTPTGALVINLSCSNNLHQTATTTSDIVSNVFTMTNLSTGALASYSPPAFNWPTLWPTLPQSLQWAFQLNLTPAEFAFLEQSVNSDIEVSSSSSITGPDYATASAMFFDGASAF